MKRFVLMLAFLLTAASTLVLTACGDDDEPATPTKCEYDAGFSSYNGDATEMSQIVSYYYAALGVKDGSFSLQGTEKECNEKVLKACEEAQKEVEKINWKSSFTYKVTLLNTMRAVYTYTYTAK